jgi:hypothetical protein
VRVPKNSVAWLVDISELTSAITTTFHHLGLLVARHNLTHSLEIFVQSLEVFGSQITERHVGRKTKELGVERSKLGTKRRYTGLRTDLLVEGELDHLEDSRLTPASFEAFVSTDSTKAIENIVRWTLNTIGLVAIHKGKLMAITHPFTQQLDGG